MDRQLVQFKSIVEIGSLNGASEALYVSQPTLTQNMKKLEERFGIKLFERTAKGIKPTPYGQVLYDHVRAMDKTYKQAIQQIEVLKHKKAFALQVGTGDVSWELCVKGALEKFQGAYPNASIHIEFGNNLYLYDRALAGHLDLFFGHEILGLDKKPGIEFMPMWDSGHGYFVRKNHPLVGREVDYEELDRYPWLEVSHHDSRYIEYIKSIEKNPLEQERRRHDVARVSTNSMAAGITFLKQQDLILPFPEEYASIFAEQDIVALDVIQEPIIERVGLYVADSEKQQIVDEFIRFAQSCCPLAETAS